LFGLGRYAEARAMFEELYAYGTRIHSTLFTGLGLRLLIELDWKVGRWAAALARQPEALEAAGGSVTVWQAAIFAEMNNDLGQPATARRDMEDMLAQLAKLDQIQTLVPCLEQLARAYTGLGLESEAAQTIQRYLELIDRNPNLHWVCDIPILFACRWYAQRADSDALDAARACVQRLERAHAQMRSPRTEAALVEARATVAAASGDVTQAATDYRRAITRWETLGHQYDSVRAYSNASRALAAAGEIEEACAAIDRALRIAETLAVQLVDEDRRESFRGSQLMQELRHSLAELVTIP
jgi:tetratricopeptide (TPR) repeat protein